jgi:hypothetical protein
MKLLLRRGDRYRQSGPVVSVTALKIGAAGLPFHVLKSGFGFKNVFNFT